MNLNLTRSAQALAQLCSELQPRRHLLKARGAAEHSHIKLRALQNC